MGQPYKTELQPLKERKLSNINENWSKKDNTDKKVDPLTLINVPRVRVLCDLNAFQTLIYPSDRITFTMIIFHQPFNPFFRIIHLFQPFPRAISANHNLKGSALGEGMDCDKRKVARHRPHLSCKIFHQKIAFSVVRKNRTT